MLAATLLLLIAPMPAGAAEFLEGPSVTLNAAKPPPARLPAATVSVKHRSGDLPFRDANAISLAIEGALAGAFTVQPEGAGMTLQFAIAHVDPVAASTFTVKELRPVRTGTRTTRRRFFRTTREDEFEKRQFTVQYWQARGTLRLLVTVRDKEHVLLDSFEAQGSCERKVETAVDGLSTNNETPPSSDALQAEMIAAAARVIRARYVRSAEPVAVTLAAGKPLMEGNNLALTGQWRDAIQEWFGAPPKTPGRAYNLAVAYEALANQTYSATGDPAASIEDFREAERLYGEAIAAAPLPIIVRAKDRCMRQLETLRLAAANARYQLACAYASQNQPGKSIEQLQSALEAGYSNRHALESDSRLDPIRANPQFRAILERLPRPAAQSPTLAATTP